MNPYDRNRSIRSKAESDRLMPNLLDVRVVAELLGCCERHVYRMAYSGQMPKPIRLGRLVRWRRRELMEWARGRPGQQCRDGGRGVAMSKDDWVHVSEKRPCPICGKPDWCLIAKDGGAAICPRTPSGKQAGEAGYWHPIGERPCSSRNQKGNARRGSLPPKRAERAKARRPKSASF